MTYLRKQHFAQSRWSIMSCWLKNHARCSIAKFAFTINPTIILNTPCHLAMTQLQRIDVDFNLLTLWILWRNRTICALRFLWSSARSAYVISIHLWVNANVPVALRKLTRIPRMQQILRSFSHLFIFIISGTVTSLTSAVICKRAD